MKNKKIILIFIPIFTATVFLLKNNQNKKVNSHRIVKVNLDEIKKNIADDFILNASLNENKKKQVEFLKNEVLLDFESKKKFADTYYYLGKNENTFAVASFMSIAHIISGNLEFNLHFNEIQKDIVENSQPIFQNIINNVENYENDIAFNMSALNLVHQLQILPEKKAEYYSKIISKPIQVLESGELDINSNSFELAIILAKQDKVKSEALRISIFKAIENAKLQNDIRYINAVQQRITNYYPETNSWFL